jgi:hypothetical protein
MDMGCKPQSLFVGERLEGPQLRARCGWQHEGTLINLTVTDRGRMDPTVTVD